MRPRLFLLVAVVACTAAASSMAAHGCSNEPPFESACLWLADPDNCYREFYFGATSYAGVNVTENPSGFCKPPGNPTQANQSSTNPQGQENGTFALRTMLDTCTLDQGGQVVLNPPLDLTMWPPSPYADPITYQITFMAPDGNTCGQATYTSPHGFSLTINPPPDAGSTVGFGGGTTTTMMTSSMATSPLADGGVPYGTFSSIIEPGRDAFDVTCPSGETHHFNLEEVEGSPGQSQGSCPGLADFLPSASFQVYPGGIDNPGAISFAITFPPISADAGVYPDASPNTMAVPNPPVVFFNCTIPGGAEQCANMVKDGQETDVDCGGPQIQSQTLCGSCPPRCQAMQQCLCDDDCDQTMGTQICVVTASGMKQCAAPDAGVGHPTCYWAKDPLPSCVPVTPDAGTDGGGTGGMGTGGMGTGGTDAGTMTDAGPG